MQNNLICLCYYNKFQIKNYDFQIISQLIVSGNCYDVFVVQVLVEWVFYGYRMGIACNAHSITLNLIE